MECRKVQIMISGPVESWSGNNIGPCVEGGSSLGGPGACSLGKFRNLASLKCTFGAF